MDSKNAFPSPSYIINESILRKNLELIKSIMQRTGVTIIPALKAFAMWKTFPIFKEYVSGASASSIYEAQLIHDYMQVPVHAYSPAYKKEDILTLNTICSHIIFNSVSQFKHLQNDIAKDIKVGLRINPELSIVDTDLYNPCSIGSRLGILAEDLTELPNGITGLHAHALCEAGANGTIQLLKNIEKIFGHILPKIDWLNLGGGHLVSKNEYDVEALVSALIEFKSKHPHLKIILEPGSAFTWQTGNLYASIIDIVTNKNISTAILDVSFTAHMPDCLEMPYKPDIENTVEKTENTFNYRLGGNSCLAGDYIGEWSFENELQIGDSIVFKDMIHYTMVKTTMFNGVQHPSIGILKKNGAVEIFKEFTYEDYKGRLS